MCLELVFGAQAYKLQTKESPVLVKALMSPRPGWNPVFPVASVFMALSLNFLHDVTRREKVLLGTQLSFHG